MVWALAAVVSSAAAAQTLPEWRFGYTKRYGATSIREQDVYPLEVISHTARYASVRSLWSELSGDSADEEEARAGLALASYGVRDRYSPNGMAYNSVGPFYYEAGWPNWYSDCYFDFLTHVLDGIAVMPELAPANRDHLLRSTTIVTKIEYLPGRIEYEAYAAQGTETLRLTFEPKVLSEGKPLPASQ